LQEHQLTIRPGEKIGVVGRSGAGKSTLVKLMLRFYDTESGAILIDGQNIGDVTQESLRQKIGMVQQDSARSSTARSATTSSMAAPTPPKR
jgi:ATP-binding cassette subfamily B multidrug efflux pump